MPTQPSVVVNQTLEALNTLRINVLDLHAHISRLVSGETLLPEEQEGIDEQRNAIAAQILTLNNDPNGDPKLVKSEYWNIFVNAWKDVQTFNLITDPANYQITDRYTRNLDRLDKTLRIMELQLGKLTIAPRLEVMLVNAGPGTAIQVNDLIATEVQTAEDRAQIMKYLADPPQKVNAIVEIDSGLVIAYSENPVERTKSLLSIGGIFVLLSIVCALVAFVPMSDWPIAHDAWPGLLLGFVFVLLGAFIHLVVVSKRQGKALGTMVPGTSTNDYSRIVNAKSSETFRRLIQSFVIYILLILLLVWSKTMAINAAFIIYALLVGYSFDSFFDIFTAGIDQKAAAQVNATKTQFGFQ